MSISWKQITVGVQCLLTLLTCSQMIMTRLFTQSYHLKTLVCKYSYYFMLRMTCKNFVLLKLQQSGLANHANNNSRPLSEQNSVILKEEQLANY